MMLLHYSGGGQGGLGDSTKEGMRTVGLRALLTSTLMNGSVLTTGAQ